MPSFQCLSCGGTYTTPQKSGAYFHVCGLKPDPANPDTEDKPIVRIPFDCPRNEAAEENGKNEGRGRRVVADAANPPALPPIGTRPCQN